MFNETVVRQIQGVAEKNHVETAALLAVADVESAGVAFWDINGQHLPPVRPEAHYFYRYLSGEKRARAVRDGLANPKAGAVRVPAARAAVYARVARMRAIDDTAALMSCSWGLGQVMGANWRSLGYASVQDMVKACDTVEGQVDLMWRYIKTNHLNDEVARKDWKGFARGYNGPRYYVAGYDKQIARAYAYYAKHGAPLPPKLQAQQPDPKVTAQQKQLAKLGYPAPTTGIPDKPTEEAVKQFQTDKGLVPDGEIGTVTRDHIETAVKEQDDATGDKLVGTGLATGSVDAAVDKLNDSTTSLQWLAGTSDIVTYLLLGLTVITVLLIGYGLYKKFKGK